MVLVVRQVIFRSVFLNKLVMNVVAFPVYVSFDTTARIPHAVCYQDTAHSTQIRLTATNATSTNSVTVQQYF